MQFVLARPDWCGNYAPGLLQYDRCLRVGRLLRFAQLSLFEGQRKYRDCPSRERAGLSQLRCAFFRRPSAIAEPDGACRPRSIRAPAQLRGLGTAEADMAPRLGQQASPERAR